MKHHLKSFAVTLSIFCLSSLAQAAPLAKAVFAGGCFWSMESGFDGVKGVVSAVSGFAGGRTANPTYEQVIGKGTGHLEAVEVTYDPAVITYDQLLDLYWRNIDPTDAGGSFADRGENYKPAVFTANDAEKKAFEASKEKLAKSGRFAKPIIVESRPAASFYAASEEHQDYAKKSSIRYKLYRKGSGRDAFFSKYWAKVWGS